VQKDFYNSIGTTRTSGYVRLESEKRSKADIAQAPLTYRDWVRGPIAATSRGADAPSWDWHQWRES